MGFQTFSMKNKDEFVLQYLLRKFVDFEIFVIQSFPMVITIKGFKIVSWSWEQQILKNKSFLY